jgi:UDP-N-acetylmuramyl pentapeptide phosphotransferase/UDP-N-acetylglucosamine-1-phosphate transferase
MVPAGSDYAIAGVLAAALSAAVTAAWIRLARRFGVVDAPGERRLHSEHTPRGGGVAMALLALAALAVVAATGPEQDASRAWATVLGLGLAAGIGLADDLLPTSSAMKLLGQAAAAAVIAWALPWPGLPGPYGMALAFAGILVAINFWNFMDGANGLVALQSAVVSLALACVLGPPAATVAVVVAAACAGFLPFNLPRARVFMGDTGSHVLGAMVAILSLWALRRGQASPGQVAVLASAFLVDAGLTLASRMIRGQRFWQAHREHLYQRAVLRGHSHLSVCLAYAGWAILAALVALGWGARGTNEGTTAAIAVGTVGAMIWLALRRHWSKRDKRMEAST